MPSYYIEYTVRYETEDYDDAWIDADSEEEARRKVEAEAAKKYGYPCDVYFDSIEVEPDPEEDDDSKDPDQQRLEEL